MKKRNQKKSKNGEVTSFKAVDIDEVGHTKTNKKLTKPSTQN